MTPEEKKQRALQMAKIIVNCATAVSEWFSSPIANASLLRKRPFPNRRIPHVKKRSLKAKANSEIKAKVLLTAIRVSSAAVQMNILRSTPSPNYPSGTN